MRRKIVSTVKIGSGKVSFTVIEEIASNLIEIFSSEDDIDQINPFLIESINEAERKIGGKLGKLAVVIEPNSKSGAKIVPSFVDVPIGEEGVTNEVINNAIELTYKKLNSSKSKAILVQPIIYKINDLITKSYSEAPLGRKGSKLTLTAMVTIISNDIYEYIYNIFKDKNVKVQNIMLAPQAISQNDLSDTALESGSILLNIDEKQSFITINKNYSTVKFISIYDYGFQNLISGVAKVLLCTKNEAKNIIMNYGKFDYLEENENIYYNSFEGSRQILINDFNAILITFIDKLFMVANKFIDQNKASDMPIVISGTLNKISSLLEYSKLKISSKHISLYNPTTFIEVNRYNKEALGVINYIKTMDRVLGKKLNTEVETNPHKVSSLGKQNKNNKKILSRIFERLGGKNVWK